MLENKLSSSIYEVLKHIKFCPHIHALVYFLYVGIKLIWAIVLFYYYNFYFDSFGKFSDIMNLYLINVFSVIECFY